jgi:outer membrane lipoprotein SlyB
VFSGCVSVPKGKVYDASQAGQIISEQKGEVVAVQDVVIKARSRHAGSPGAGATIGSAAAVGAILGNPLSIATAAGSVVGGIAGATMDNQQGEELTILLKDGRTVVIVQERGEVPFAPGDHVRILSGSGSAYEPGASKVMRDDVIADTRR